MKRLLLLAFLSVIVCEHAVAIHRNHDYCERRQCRLCREYYGDDENIDTPIVQEESCSVEAQEETRVACNLANQGNITGEVSCIAQNNASPMLPRNVVVDQ